MKEIQRNATDFKLVHAMAVPILIEIFLRTLMGNIDQFMLSEFSSTGVAAVSNANQVINLGIIVLDVVCVAITIMLAQYIGAQKTQDIDKLCTLSLGLIAFLSIILSAILCLCGEFFLNMIQIPPELMEDAKTYLFIVGISLIMQGFFMGFSAIFRSHGKMKEIMVISMTMNIINVIMNYLLIHGNLGFPSLGVAGAAYATLVSRLIGCGMLALLFRPKLGISLHKKYLIHPELKSIKQIFVIGFPAAGDTISYNCMQMVLLTFINICGTKSVTAKVYVGMVVMFVMMYSVAIGTATQIHIGYFVGGNRADDAKKLAYKSMVSSIVVSEIIAIILYLFKDSIFTVFTQEPEILRIISGVLFVEIFLELGRAINIIMIKSL